MRPPICLHTDPPPPPAATTTTRGKGNEHGSAAAISFARHKMFPSGAKVAATHTHLSAETRTGLPSSSEVLCSHRHKKTMTYLLETHVWCVDQRLVLDLKATRSSSSNNPAIFSPRHRTTPSLLLSRESEAYDDSLLWKLGRFIS